MVANRLSAFDAVCAGEALWDLTTSSARGSLRFRPSGGAVDAAIAIARSGLRVGLATTVADDSFGRALIAKVAAVGVDIGGVTLAPPRAGLVSVEVAGTAHRVVPSRAEQVLEIAVPANWATQVLLISGLSPVIAHAAGLCKAARAARRGGALVVVDINARWHAWAGQDARAIRAVVGEADVIRCSTEDLVGLGIDTRALVTMMRRRATLVLTDGPNAARVMGDFGELALSPKVVVATKPAGAGDAFTAAIVVDLARAGDPSVDRSDRWERALARGHAAAAARVVAVRHY